MESKTGIVRSRKVSQKTPASNPSGGAGFGNQMTRSSTGLSLSKPLMLTLAVVVVAAFFFSRQDPGDDLDLNIPKKSQELSVSAMRPSALSSAVSAVPKQESTTTPMVAYVISLIECRGTKGAGFIDAALVLRHSIHQNSVRNPASGSKYDYKLYAIVHEQAKSCAPSLEQAGYEIMIRDPPVKTEEIRGEFLRKNIHKEMCCGADEFVKLFAYHLFHEKVIVHLDIDFIFRKPMDDVIDAMLGDKSARSRIPVEGDFQWPEGEVEAMFTRDWPSVNVPGRKSGFQAGFWVLKPSQKHFDKLLEIVREGNYIEGFTRQNGWYGLGYGGFVGAKAMQGLLAYYYDEVAPGTWVELNHCNFNHIAVHTKVKGKCRNGTDKCEPCEVTPLDDIFSVHYTACRKPWQCIGVASSEPEAKSLTKALVLREDMVIKDHCLDLLKIWHGYRTDLEEKLFKVTADDSIVAGQKGTYKQDYFMGHCTQDQAAGYLKLADGNDDSLRRIPEIYK